jgi:hypothetical protein
MVQTLLCSDEPAVRYRAITRLAGGSTYGHDALAAQEAVRHSPQVAALLAERGEDGRIAGSAYSKWTGAHWVLAALADLGYPAGDESLIPLREQVLGWLLSERHTGSIRAIDGRVRRCASQEGNALYALMALGLADDRAEELATRLMGWQWPDGGWNCDKRPEAQTSSFMESLIPLRALALYTRYTGSGRAASATQRAAEVFLSRRMFRGRRDGQVMRPDFTTLHYPCYWHYDVLFGLTVLAEAGLIGDERCAEALDLLEEKRLPGGGWPAEAKYYRVSTDAADRRSGRSTVDWGGASARRMNEFVTVDALWVLRAAGRGDGA